MGLTPLLSGISVALMLLQVGNSTTMLRICFLTWAIALLSESSLYLSFVSVLVYILVALAVSSTCLHARIVPSRGPASSCSHHHHPNSTPLRGPQVHVIHSEGDVAFHGGGDVASFTTQRRSHGRDTDYEVFDPHEDEESSGASLLHLSLPPVPTGLRSRRSSSRKKEIYLALTDPEPLTRPKVLLYVIPLMQFCFHFSLCAHSPCRRS